MSLKSNIEYWNELEKNGWLYSYLKDGKPEGIIDLLIGFGYPIIMTSIIGFCLFFYSKLPENKKKFKSFVTSVSVASLLGWGWGVWMINADPNFPSWLFPPWAITNIEFILTLEDWLFYPGCTTLFYIIYRYIDIEDMVENRILFINIIIILYSFLILFFLFFTALCGQTVAILFALPGLILFIYCRDVLNIKKFILFMPAPLILNCIWDWSTVSWIHEIEGMAWASHWIYISFNQAGEHIQSTVFLDYFKYPWAWVFNNPIENTPWLGFSGAILDFSLFAAVDKYFDKKGIKQ